MGKPPRLSTYFFISGRNFDPEICTSALGIEPTEIWRQKHEHLKQRKDIPNISWQLGKKKRHLYSVSEAVEEILDLIWPAREKIKMFTERKEFEVGIDCSVTIFDDRPVYELLPHTIQRLAVIGCGFGLDIFDYS